MTAECSMLRNGTGSAAGASAGKESAMWRRTMTAVACACLLTSGAYAQSYYGPRDGRGAYTQQGERHAPPSNPPRRGADDRDRYERDQGGRRGLTPDERRELDRDLLRANREIYRKGRDSR